jgi:LysM repeat protein
MKKIFLLITLLVMIGIPVASARAESPGGGPLKEPQVDTDPYSMIAEVNALRAANGLPAYSLSAILMSTAQAQAEFMSANGVSHSGPGGSSVTQRLLAAGYPLAGDLSLGGFRSENITAGNNKSVQQAVLEWQGDAPHLNTMLSPNLMEIGAGVAYVGDYVYYVIDCARPTTGGQQQVYPTPVPGSTQAAGAVIVPAAPLASTIIPSTPAEDGRLYHVVGPGETLWLIAISYGVKIADIRRLNNMAEADAIYPKEKLLIRDSAALVAAVESEAGTPASPLDTDPAATAAPTFTPVPSWTPLPAPTQIAPTPVPVAPASSDSSLIVLGAIVTAALILAGVLVRAGSRG